MQFWNSWSLFLRFCRPGGFITKPNMERVAVLLAGMNIQIIELVKLSLVGCLKMIPMMDLQINYNEHKLFGDRKSVV